MAKKLTGAYPKPALILSPDYFQQEDVLFLGVDLLGKVIVSEIDNIRCCGLIVETESYKGPEDKASHAYNMRKTKRNEIMYARGGYSYVFCCYGTHVLFNVVTNRQDIPHAILIRGIYPIEGLDVMQKRRGCKNKKLGIGPGNVTKCLGIGMQHNGHWLQHTPLQIQDIGIRILPEEISHLPRVGIDYAEEHALLPWRFCVTADGLARLKNKF